MNAASYDLVLLQERVRAGEYRITAVALEGAGRLGWGVEEICECVLGLAASDLLKTMQSERKPGLWQDVYRPHFRGVRLYVKLQLTWVGDAVVISFKRRRGGCSSAGGEGRWRECTWTWEISVCNAISVGLRLT